MSVNRSRELQKEIQSGLNQLDAGYGVNGVTVFDNIREMSRVQRDAIERGIQVGLDDVAAGRCEEVISDSLNDFMPSLDEKG